MWPNSDKMAVVHIEVILTTGWLPTSLCNLTTFEWQPSRGQALNASGTPVLNNTYTCTFAC